MNRSATNFPNVSQNANEVSFSDDERNQIKQRLSALKYYQECHQKLEHDLHHEINELEKKYQILMDPLYTKRQEIVSGKREPLPEEISNLVEDEIIDFDMLPTAPIRGIPSFWLKVLRNCSAIGPAIQIEDAVALSSLLDIRCISSEPAKDEESKGFAIQFVFDKNDYFSNEILEKSFFFAADADEFSEEHFLYAKGTEINWNEGKCLTSKKVTKSQRNKKTGATRNVSEVVQVPSFFSFFKTIEGPISLSSEENDIDQQSQIDSEEFELLEQQIYEEFYIGELLRTKIIPYAYNWYCGNMVLSDDEEDDYEEDGEGHCCDDSDCEHTNCDYGSDDDSENDASLPAKPECKNQ